MKTIRTMNQMRNRCQFGNLAANSQLFARRLARPFEFKPPRQTDFNLFVQANYGVHPVYLTRHQVLSGACVLAPYLFTRGSLAPIVCSIENGVLVSDLNLGELVIGESTTVGELSQALIDNNHDWREGDEISFLHAVQIIDPYLEVPRARMNSCRLVLDTTDSELLSNIVLPAGFASVASNENDNENENGPSTGSGTYRLGMNTPLENAGAAWVHNRKRADGGYRVSTQYLHIVSSILADYQSEEAFQQSAESYGAKIPTQKYL